MRERLSEDSDPKAGILVRQITFVISVFVVSGIRTRKGYDIVCTLRGRRVPKGGSYEIWRESVLEKPYS